MVMFAVGLNQCHVMALADLAGRVDERHPHPVGYHPAPVFGYGQHMRVQMVGRTPSGPTGNICS